jgi:hypothetical protein
MTTFTVTPHLSARLAQGPLRGIAPRYQLLLFEQGLCLFNIPTGASCHHGS